jgi:hypothetical protein
MWETLLEPLRELLDALVVRGPKFLATLVILIGGWIVAKLLKLAIVRGFKLIKLDVVAEKAGIEAFLKRGGMKKTAIEILGTLVYWIALLVFLVMILSLWNIDIGLQTTLVPFLPKVFAALVIFILGLFIASIVEDIVRATAANAGIRYAYVLSKILKWIMVVFVVMTAIQQLEVETQFLSIGFLIILGSLGLGVALAIGLGAREIASTKLGRWVEDMEQEAAIAKDEGDEKTD